MRARVCDTPMLAASGAGRAQEEETVKLSTRWAALAAVTMIAAACGGAGASSAPNQAAATTAATTPASAAPASATAEAIAPPTSLITPGKIVDCVDIEYPPMEYFASSDITD